MWKQNKDVKYLDMDSDYYSLPVAGLIWEIKAPGGGVMPSLTIVAEKRATVTASGEKVDIFRAYFDTSSGPDAWRTEVTRFSKSGVKRV